MSSESFADPPRRRGGWAAALAATLVAGAGVYGMSPGTEREAPANPLVAAAPPPAQPATDPPPPSSTAPAPKTPHRAEVVAAVDALAPRLRRCPESPRRLPLVLEVGGATRVVELLHHEPDATLPFDRCALEVVNPLYFEGAPAQYAMTVVLAD